MHRCASTFREVHLDSCPFSFEGCLDIPQAREDLFDRLAVANTALDAVDVALANASLFRDMALHRKEPSQ